MLNRQRVFSTPSRMGRGVILVAGSIVALLVGWLIALRPSLALLPILLALGCSFFLRPDWLFILYLFMSAELIDTSLLPSVGFGSIRVGTPDLTLLGLMLMALVMIRRISNSWQPVDRAIRLSYVGWLIIMLFSVLYSMISVGNSLTTISYEARYLLPYLCLPFFLMIAQTKNQVVRCAWNIILLADISAAIGILAQFGVIDFQQLGVRVILSSYSGMVRSSTLGEAFVMTGFGVILAMLMFRSRWTKWQFLLLLLSAVITFLGGFMTWRRSFWVVLALGLLLAAIYILRSVRKSPVQVWLLAAGVIVIVSLVFFALAAFYNAETIAQRATSLSFESLGSELESRTREWRLAEDAWSKSPIFGIGMGTLYGQTRTLSDGQALYSTPQYYIHNMYLWLGTKMGIVGLLAFLSVTFFSCRRSLCLVLQGRSETHKLAGMLSLAIWGSLLVVGTVEAGFTSFSWSILFVCAIGFSSFGSVVERVSSCRV